MLFFFGGTCPEHVMEMFQMLIFHCGDLERMKINIKKLDGDPDGYP